MIRFINANGEEKFSITDQDEMKFATEEARKEFEEAAKLIDEKEEEK